MSIQELTAVSKPPAITLEQGDAQQRQAIEKTLGITLPTDLFDFASTYGTGYFGVRLLVVYNPFGARYLDLIADDLRILERTRNSHLEMGYDEPLFHVPFASHPARPGLLPWGSDGNSRTYWWLTDGESSDWPVIVQREDTFGRWDLSMTSFLAQMFNNKLKSPLFQSRSKPSEKVFTSSLTV